MHINTFFSFIFIFLCYHNITFLGVDWKIKNKEEHIMKRIHRCSLCGNIFNNIVFKGGYVCEDCIDFIKSPARNTTGE